MSEENKYRQLGMFGVIVAEVVVTPTLLGGLTFWLLKDSSLQLALTPIAALVGLGIAFYRISLLRRRYESHES